LSQSRCAPTLLAIPAFSHGQYPNMVNVRA
jgi:hypothetical protein